MIIKNCEIETTMEFKDDINPDEYRGAQQPTLTIKIKIPNGQAIYKIPIQDALKSSIEKASGLQK